MSINKHACNGVCHIIRILLHIWDLKIDKSVGFPYLKMEKLVGFTELPFHVFDRYEIHVQAFVNFIYAF